MVDLWKADNAKTQLMALGNATIARLTAAQQTVQQIQTDLDSGFTSQAAILTAIMGATAPDPAVGYQPFVVMGQQKQTAIDAACTAFVAAVNAIINPS